MVKTAVKDGSPGDNKIRFVFQPAYVETSCIASRRRTFEEASKGRFDQGAAGSGQSTGASNSSRDWSSGWWRGSRNSGEGWNSWKELLERLSPVTGGRSMKEVSRFPGKKEAKKKARSFESISSEDLKSLWNRISPRRWNSELLEV